MDVSIIIVNYNTFQLTCNCIASVIERSEGFSYEIILVDNCSTEVDADEFKKRFPQIVLIVSDQNLGFAKGNNLGIRVAQGKYILLLNSDTVLKNNAVRIAKDHLEKNPDTAVVAARLEYPDGTVQHNCQRFPSIRYKLFEWLRLQKLLSAGRRGKILFGFFFDHNTPAFPDWVWGTFFMFRKDLLKELPDQKLADDFFMYQEDMQWCFEFRRRGHSIAFEPAAQVIHYMGQSGGASKIWMAENAERFMEKYHSPLSRWIIRSLDKLLTP
jgi:GT2 family glycosyltransferase